ncbi:MAG: amidohydrolase [Caldilineales bacterium]|nr:amidohydrolase [Caldilineales bacterium]
MIDFHAAAATLAPDLIAWRRDFHRHPELGFQEVRTAGIVAAHLRGLGIETSTGVGQTGVVGVIEGRGPGPTLLLRFDMDALPVTEETGLSFASLHPGRMHACGHDGHTAIGMGVATLLAQSSQTWPGRVKLIFQPAEEGLGGALAMVRDGVLEQPAPDAALALHLWNAHPSGVVYAQAGPLMAAADRFSVEISGRGGHGAEPHTTIDALFVAVQAITALHSIVSRNVPPLATAVLSVGSLHSGEAFNVIAERAQFTGTLRTFDPAIRALLIRRMEEVLAGVTAAHGATYTLALADHTPAVINDPALAALAAQAAAALLGPAQMQTAPPLMVAEDMADIFQRVRGCYLLVGAAPPGGARGGHHSPRFDFDEAMLPVAAGLLTAAAVAYLHTPPSS